MIQTAYSLVFDSARKVDNHAAAIVTSNLSYRRMKYKKESPGGICGDSPSILWGPQSKPITSRCRLITNLG